MLIRESPQAPEHLVGNLYLLPPPQIPNPQPRAKRLFRSFDSKPLLMVSVQCNPNPCQKSCGTHLKLQEELLKDQTENGNCTPQACVCNRDTEAKGLVREKEISAGGADRSFLSNGSTCFASQPQH